MAKEVAEVQNNMPATLQEELAALQKRVSAPSGSRIGLNAMSGQFKVPGVGEVEGPIDVIIVDFASQNAYYKGAFNKNDIKPPVCAAVGAGTNDELVPDAGGDVQSEDCKSCPFNQFGSNGAGKMCKNTKIVALLPADASADNESDIMTINVSPTGLKKFDTTITHMAVKHGRLPRMMKVSMYAAQAGNSDAKTVGFQDPQPLNDDQIAYTNSRLEEARSILATPPSFG